VNCCSIFPYDFFYNFFQNYLCPFVFNIELVKNYNYDKAKSYWESVVVFSQNTMDCYSISLNSFLFYFIGESTVAFFTKYCQLPQCFFSWGFFPSKIIFVHFF
jgi:hypothetical protein